jgi:hypothetical protein
MQTEAKLYSIASSQILDIFSLEVSAARIV